ncbi:uncharacterized protein K444DRAFT_664744 [Hyaloscypha bicolor E]|uniref:Uncharacterized protein n=1 Tax=Hyaloscypha bicolor E TaxID=1095630 RepID=A0A2J6T5I2_9HELO|nr:uncharacterized protein K444DRAFT_664744 [Hyaloscypha bicolor E]PMD58269.1 hypothetical protein K444DRAFT_664744 [Hyaloscypha bicolor E]
MKRRLKLSYQRSKQEVQQNTVIPRKQEQDERGTRTRQEEGRRFATRTFQITNRPMIQPISLVFQSQSPTKRRGQENAVVAKSSQFQRQEQGKSTRLPPRTTKSQREGPQVEVRRFAFRGNKDERAGTVIRRIRSHTLKAKAPLKKRTFSCTFSKQSLPSCVRCYEGPVHLLKKTTYASFSKYMSGDFTTSWKRKMKKFVSTPLSNPCMPSSPSFLSPALPSYPLPLRLNIHRPLASARHDRSSVSL